MFKHGEGNPIPAELLPAWSRFEKNDALFDARFPEFGIHLHFILDAFFYNERRKSTFVSNDSTEQGLFENTDKGIRNLEIDYKLKELLLAKNLSWTFMNLGLTPSTQSVFTKFKKEFPNSSCLKSLQKTYAGLQQLQKGELAPDIVCLTPEDEEISFSNLKGKVLYIDFWATWCGPCIKEFLASQLLKEKYQEVDISFVYISIDEDLAKWKDFLTKKEAPKGIHLVEKEKGELLEKYQLLEVPRYIIIDAEGRIVDWDAPRPSSGEVEKIIDGLLEMD